VSDCAGLYLVCYDHLGCSIGLLEVTSLRAARLLVARIGDFPPK